jgi:hypothetical protein
MKNFMPAVVLPDDVRQQVLDEIAKREQFAKDITTIFDENFLRTMRVKPGYFMDGNIGARTRKIEVQQFLADKMGVKWSAFFALEVNKVLKSHNIQSGKINGYQYYWCLNINDL